MLDSLFSILFFIEFIKLFFVSFDKESSIISDTGFSDDFFLFESQEVKFFICLNVFFVFICLCIFLIFRCM